MVRQGLETLGFKTTIDELTYLSEGGLKEELADFIASTAAIAEELALAYVPKDTGELARSIFVDYGSDWIELGTKGCRYAIYNEYGSIISPLGMAKYAGQRPFLRPALYEAMRQFEEIYESGGIAKLIFSGGNYI